VKSIAVFCGSSSGADPRFAAAAHAFGELMAAEGLALVYGGGHVGLMGVVADAVLARGGKAIGVIPRALWDREVGHRGLTELRIVDSMHERKATMASLADAFVALPGGLGTLEEIFEVWTWAQLGIHRKPVAFLDVAGFYAPLMQFLDSAVAAGFLRQQFRDMALIDDDAPRLLARLRAYVPPDVTRWMHGAET
jgi:uncharacterized protein (TIGR00730 family)